MSRLWILLIFAASLGNAESARINSENPTLCGDLVEDNILTKLDPFLYVKKRRPPGSKLKDKALVVNETVLNLGLIYGRERSFLKLVYRAIQSGRIQVVDAGAVIGPKVLLNLTKLTKVAPLDHSTVRYKGYLFVDKVLEAQRAQASDPAPKDEYVSWSPREAQSFNEALPNLKIVEACKTLFKTDDLNKCGLMYFFISVNDTGVDIRWNR